MLLLGCLSVQTKGVLPPLWSDIVVRESMCWIGVEGALGETMWVLGWDKPKVIQRGTSRVFGVNSGRC